MRASNAALQFDASTSMAAFGWAALRADNSGWAMTVSPIHEGATTRMFFMARCALVPGSVMPAGAFSGEAVLGAAVRALGLVLLHEIEEHAGMARPQRRTGPRAGQRQVVGGND